MKSLAIGIAMLLTASMAQAEMDCTKGNPWRLPLPPSGWGEMQAAIKVDGKAQVVLICNCTADVAGKTTGVWIRATPDSAEAARLAAKPAQARPRALPADARSGPGGTYPYYLPGKSCAFVGTATVILAPADAVESYGWFQAQP